MTTSVPATRTILSFSPNVRIANSLTGSGRQRDDGVADRDDRGGRRARRCAATSSATPEGDGGGEQSGERAETDARPRRPPSPGIGGAGRGSGTLLRSWSRSTFGRGPGSGFVVPACSRPVAIRAVPGGPAAHLSRWDRAHFSRTRRGSRIDGRPGADADVRPRRDDRDGAARRPAPAQRGPDLVRAARRRVEPDRREAQGMSSERRRSAPCVLLLAPYLVIGLIFALAAWFLPRRHAVGPLAGPGRRVCCWSRPSCLLGGLGRRGDRRCRCCCSSCRSRRSPACCARRRRSWVPSAARPAA